VWLSRKHGTVFLPTSLHQLLYRLSRDNLKLYLPNLSHHFKLLSHIFVPCPRSYLAYATLISTFFYYYYYYYYSEKNSRNGRVCARCGSSTHPSDQCWAKQCVNCQGSQLVDSRECPRWIAEKEKLKSRAEKISPLFPLFQPSNGNILTYHKTAVNKLTFFKHIVLEGTDPNMPLGKLSPFLLQKLCSRQLEH